MFRKCGSCAKPSPLRHASIPSSFFILIAPFTDFAEQRILSDMKHFKYTARNSNGMLVKGTITAADRASVLSNLKAQQLTPVSVTDDDTTHQRFPGSGSSFFGQGKSIKFVVGLGLCLVCVLFFSLSNRSNVQRLKKQPPAPKTAQSTGTTVVAHAKSTTNNLVDPAQKKERSGQHQPNQIAPNHSAPLSATNHVMTEREEALARAQEASDTSLNTITENTLALMASVPPELPMPPMPKIAGLSNDFATASTNIIQIKDKDDEAMARRKEAVAWTKLDMAQLVKEGHTPEAILQAIEAKHNEKATARQAYYDYAKALVQEGKVTEAHAFIEEANKELEKAGLPAISLVSKKKITVKSNAQ